MNQEPDSKTTEQSRRKKYRRLAWEAPLWLLGSLIFVGLLICWPPNQRPSWTDVILAVATIAYVLVTFYQWRALSETLEETRRANDLSLRSWVMARKLKLVELTADHGKYAMRLLVKNYGRSPAIHWSRSNSVVVTYPGESIFTGPAPRYFEPERGSSIAPGATRASHMSLWPLTPEEVDDVREGKAFLWVILRYSYTDMTGAKGTSVYAWRFIPERPLSAGDGLPPRRARFEHWWTPETGDW